MKLFVNIYFRWIFQLLYPLQIKRRQTNHKNSRAFLLSRGAAKSTFQRDQHSNINQRNSYVFKRASEYSPQISIPLCCSLSADFYNHIQTVSKLKFAVISPTSHQLSFGILLPWSESCSCGNHMSKGGGDSAINKIKWKIVFKYLGS